MGMVTVYRFELYDRRIRAFRASSDYATLRTIDAFGAVALTNTGREVDEALLNASGIIALADLDRAPHG